jgi:hypothetical protein
MRALNTVFELSWNRTRSEGASDPEVRQSSKLSESGEMLGIARKYKNRGNEAKEYLKTKDITFLNGANLEHIARNLSAIEPQDDQTTPAFAKTRSALAIPMQCCDTDKKSARQSRDSPGCRPNLVSGSWALSTDSGTGLLETENLPRVNNVCGTLRKEWTLLS